MGWIEGENLRCRYHGLLYEPGGRCIKIPGQDRVGEWACLRSYPVVESNKWVMVWMGEPEKAATTRAPDFHRGLGDPTWRHINGTLHIPSNYKLLLDNLLDLSHLAYLHNTTIGNEVMADADLIYNEDPDRLRVTRFMRNIPPSSAFAEFGRYSADAKIDRWQVTEYMPPTYFLINNGTDPAGKVDLTPEVRAKGRGTWGFQVYHGITPETDTSTFQFWAIAHPREFVDPSQYEKFNVVMGKQVLSEDMEAYIGQHRALMAMDPSKARSGDVSPLGEIRADRGLVIGRRMLDKLVAQEHKVVT
jgi:vanillate O-demethylase monooxygenase subunit